MAVRTAHKGGKKNRKHGNNKVFCAEYKSADRERVNRKRRWRSTLYAQRGGRVVAGGAVSVVNMQLLERYEAEFGTYQQNVRPPY